MNRRLIPPLIALAFGLAAFSPLMTGWPSDDDTNTWTLFALVGMFAFKAGLFFWMRQRMRDGVRLLTQFGAALVDFFTAVVVCDAWVAVVFVVAYWYARQLKLAPFWLRLTDRSVLILSVALVISTGVAVAYEMYRADEPLRVHEEGV